MSRGCMGNRVRNVIVHTERYRRTLEKPAKHSRLDGYFRIGGTSGPSSKSTKLGSLPYRVKEQLSRAAGERLRPSGPPPHIPPVPMRKGVGC